MDGCYFFLMGGFPKRKPFANICKDTHNKEKNVVSRDASFKQAEKLSQNLKKKTKKQPAQH